jgi:uncharacterized repeat protein (TIGR03943 family)
VSRPQQGILLLLLGALVGKVALTDLHLRYVRPGMQPLLVVTSALLVLAAVRCLLGGRSEEGTTQGVFDKSVLERERDPDPEPDHPGPPSAWLLAVPSVVLLLTSPAALGSFAANRLETRVAPPKGSFAPLPKPVDGAVDLTLQDFYQRAYFDPDGVKDTRVRVRGFVSGDDTQWSVTLLVVGCCAADAQPVKVQVQGVPAPPVDTWVSVEGEYAGRADRVVKLAASVVEPIPKPKSPYVYS